MCTVHGHVQGLFYLLPHPSTLAAFSQQSPFFFTLSLTLFLFLSLSVHFFSPHIFVLLMRHFIFELNTENAPNDYTEYSRTHQAFNWWYYHMIVLGEKAKEQQQQQQHWIDVHCSQYSNPNQVSVLYEKWLIIEC